MNFLRDWLVVELKPKSCGHLLCFSLCLIIFLVLLFEVTTSKSSQSDLDQYWKELPFLLSRIYYIARPLRQFFFRRLGQYKSQFRKQPWISKTELIIGRGSAIINGRFVLITLALQAVVCIVPDQTKEKRVAKQRHICQMFPKALGSIRTDRYWNLNVKRKHHSHSPRLAFVPTFKWQPQDNLSNLLLDTIDILSSKGGLPTVNGSIMEISCIIDSLLEISSLKPCLRQLQTLGIDFKPRLMMGYSTISPSVPPIEWIQDSNHYVMKRHQAAWEVGYKCAPICFNIKVARGHVEKRG